MIQIRLFKMERQEFRRKISTIQLPCSGVVWTISSELKLKHTSEPSFLIFYLVAQKGGGGVDEKKVMKGPFRKTFIMELWGGFFFFFFQSDEKVSETACFLPESALGSTPR